MKINSYPLLDKWVSDLDIKAAIKILQLLKILKAESDQFGGNVFITPVKAFQEANFDQNLYESILFNLHDRGIIYAVNTISMPISKDPAIPSGSVDCIADNLRVVKTLFKYVLTLLQIKVGDISEKQKRLDRESILKLQNLKLNLSINNKYRMARKFIDVIIREDGQIPDYVLAQAVKPTTKNNHYQARKLNKKDYLHEKKDLDTEIRNRLKTFNPLLKQIGYQLKLRNHYWVFTTISN